MPSNIFINRKIYTNQDFSKMLKVFPQVQDFQSSRFLTHSSHSCTKHLVVLGWSFLRCYTVSANMPISRWWHGRVVF